MLKDVKHVPAIWMNLISMERFDDEGLYSLHGGGEWNLFLGFLYCGSR